MYRKTLNKKTEDAHDNATLSIDQAGHLYVFCNAHGTARPSYIYRSTKPYDITDFERIYEGNFSYGDPWYVPGQGFLLLHTHYEKANEHRLFWITSDEMSAACAKMKVEAKERAARTRNRFKASLLRCAERTGRGRQELTFIHE